MIQIIFYLGKHPIYHGASPISMKNLAKRIGYRLVGANNWLWNYLYLSDLLTEFQSQKELDELIGIISNGTAVTWHHINMLGEYDFNSIQFDNSSRFDMQKLKAWKYQKSA